MEPQEIALIEGFLLGTGFTSLFEYHGVTPDSPPAVIEERIKEKRAWAQTQQANPKYRTYALWLIKNHALVRRVMLEAPADYVATIAERDLRRKMEMLDLFLEGSMVHGQVSPKARDAIRRRAADMGLTDDEIEAYLRKRLTSVVARDDEAAATNGWDPYVVLGIRRDSPLEVIEQAYRSRYRWARSLRDLTRAQAVYQELDRAWRDLSTPERRAALNAGLDPDGSVLRTERSPAGPASPPGQGPRIGSRFGVQAPADAVMSGPHFGDLGFHRNVGRPPVATRPPAPEVRPGGAVFRPPPRRIPLEEAVTPEPRDAASAAPPRLGPPTDPPVEAEEEEVLPARLHVDAPPTIELSTWYHPVRTTFHVTNQGAGPMPGTLASSQPWLTVQPRLLDPHARDTEVELTFWPRLVPGRAGTARLSVTTAHGQRRVITVRARKRPIYLPIIGGLAASLLLVVLVSRTGWVPVPFLPGPEAGPVRTRLSLTVSPGADAILLDGARVGAGALLDLPNPAPPGRRVHLRIDRRGCLSHDDDLVFGDGQRLDLRVTLKPDPASSGGCS